MTYIDPLMNAARVDLLGGKSGGLFACWDSLPIPPRGKRAVPAYSDNHPSSNDLLRSSTSCCETVSYFRPVSSVTETIFHRGFQRRLFPGKDEERCRIDNQAWERFNQRTAEAIQSYVENPRNLVTGQGVPDVHVPRKKNCGKLSSIFESDRAKECYKRNINNEGRFFMPRPVRSLSAKPCETVIVGFPGARKANRAASVGIFDNFSHTQAPLNLQPPRRPSRRNISQITLL